MLDEFRRKFPGFALADGNRRGLGLSHRGFLPRRPGRGGRRRLVLQFVDRDIVVNRRLFDRRRCGVNRLLTVSDGHFDRRGGWGGGGAHRATFGPFSRQGHFLFMLLMPALTPSAETRVEPVVEPGKEAEWSGQPTCNH